MNITIDFSNVKDKKTLYDYLKQVFYDYEFYGSNLDALMEVLMCLKGVCLKLININVLSETLNDYASKVIGTFKLASRENNLLTVIIEEV